MHKTKCIRSDRNHGSTVTSRHTVLSCAHHVDDRAYGCLKVLHTPSPKTCCFCTCIFVASGSLEVLTAARVLTPNATGRRSQHPTQDNTVNRRLAEYQVPGTRYALPRGPARPHSNPTCTIVAYLAGGRYLVYRSPRDASTLASEEFSSASVMPLAASCGEDKEATKDTYV